MLKEKWLKFWDHFLSIGVFLIPDIIVTVQAPLTGVIIMVIQFSLIVLLLVSFRFYVHKFIHEFGLDFLSIVATLGLPIIFHIAEGSAFIAVLMILFYFIVGTIWGNVQEKLDDIRFKNKCQGCGRNEKPHTEIPYCEECFKISFEKTQALIDEAEQRISLANKLGLSKQAEGAKKWFQQQSLPGPIKWILEQQKKARQEKNLNKLREHFPNAKIFDPSEGFGFDKFPIDSCRPDLNIPKEGLELLVNFQNEKEKIALLSLKGGEE